MVCAPLATGLLLAGLLSTGAAASASDQSSEEQRSAVRVQVVDTNSPFSPNDDGHKDRAVVRYRLSQNAHVVVEVRHGAKTVFRTPSKATSAGNNAFRWKGQKTSGKRAADGRYRILIHATGRRDAWTASAMVTLRTRPTQLDAGDLELSSDTVYPYAKAINDVVVGNVSLPGPVGGQDSLSVVEYARAQVLDKTGRVISVEPVTEVERRALGMDDPVSCGRCGRFTWDGRDEAGVRQLPGTYRIRIVQGRDAAGNIRILTPPQQVKVSLQQLRRQTTTVTLLAADTPRTGMPDNGCMGCGEGACYPTASTRFSGGLTFDLTRPGCQRVTQLFTVPVPGRRTPYDRFGVAATGGPSSPGADTSATLSTVSGYYPPAVRLTGDTTATSQSSALMTPNTEVYPDAWPPAVIWEVSASTGSYDLASFTVVLDTFVPAG